mmetsp:Transcript_65375/g.165654  ORF Transcript_65375/g.165654 Transcript_65375/m.165654 type:complete len:310 (-) Transcript_65375:1497-2426(-)
MVCSWKSCRSSRTTCAGTAFCPASSASQPRTLSRIRRCSSACDFAADRFAFACAPNPNSSKSASSCSKCSAKHRSAASRDGRFCCSTSARSAAAQSACSSSMEGTFTDTKSRHESTNFASKQAPLPSQAAPGAQLPGMAPPALGPHLPSPLLPSPQLPSAQAPEAPPPPPPSQPSASATSLTSASLPSSFACATSSRNIARHSSTPAAPSPSAIRALLPPPSAASRCKASSCADCDSRATALELPAPASPGDQHEGRGGRRHCHNNRDKAPCLGHCNGALHNKGLSAYLQKSNASQVRRPRWKASAPPL